MCPAARPSCFTELNPMRPTPNLRIEHYRAQDTLLGPSQPGENWGVFRIPRLGGSVLYVIASDGLSPVEEGWEHVSVSHHDGIPTWDEMQFVKELFWTDDEAVFQFHPPKSEYVNFNPNVLHLWRHKKHQIPLPPKILLAPADQ